MTTTAHNLQPIPSELQLREVTTAPVTTWQAQQLRLLWHHRQLLFRAVAFGLIISTVIAFLIPKTYTSTAMLMPPDTQSQSGLAVMAALVGKTGSGLGAMAGDLLGLKSTGSLFVGMLRSETCQDRLVQQFDLKRVYGENYTEDARAKLAEHTAIVEDRKSGIISISVTERSPQRAAALANAYIDQLNLLVTELSTSSAHRERVFLEQRLKFAKQELDDASSQLGQFSSKNNTMDIQQMGRAMLDAAGNLAGELIAAQSELEGLRQIYTDNNPRVRSLSARVAVLRTQLEKLGGADVRGKTGETATGSADTSSEMPYPTIRELPLLGVKYADYYRRAKIQETVYSLLTEQYELAKIQEAKETPSVKVLDPGRVPEKKSSPHRLLVILLGTFLAFCATLIWILASASWQSVDPDDPRKTLAIEVAASLKEQMHSARWKRWIPWVSRNGHSSGPANGDTVIGLGEHFPSTDADNGKQEE